MPTYKVDTQKVNNGVYWTNVWHVVAPSLTAAHVIALDIAAIESSQLFSYMSITLVRTSEPGPAPGFISENTAIVGARTQSPGDNPLPAWNRFNIALVPASGYHGKKFLLWVSEADQDNGTLTQTALTRLTSQVCQPLEALNALCSPDGEPYVSVNPIATVGMRQLRRARKRTQPVITP